MTKLDLICSAYFSLLDILGGDKTADRPLVAFLACPNEDTEEALRYALERVDRTLTLHSKETVLGALQTLLDAVYAE